MSWTSLKNGIATVIKTNGNQEITGNALQGVLNTIVNSLGAHATFAGFAIPSTSPGTPDGPVFYLALQVGSYSNFGATPFVVSKGEFGIFRWNGTTWSTVKYTPDVDLSEIISELNALDSKIDEQLNALGPKLSKEKNDFPQYNYSILTTGKFGSDASYRHGVIAVTPGEIYSLVGDGTTVYRYAFATSDSYAAGEDIPLVDDTSVVEVAGGRADNIVIPSGCAYFIFSVGDYYGTRLYKNNAGLQSIEQSINEKILPSFAEIAANRIITRTGSLFKATTTNNYITKNRWYIGRTHNSSVQGYENYCKYILVSVAGGDVVRLNPINGTTPHAPRVVFFTQTPTAPSSANNNYSDVTNIMASDVKSIGTQRDIVVPEGATSMYVEHEYAPYNQTTAVVIAPYTTIRDMNYKVYEDVQEVKENLSEVEQTVNEQGDVLDKKGFTFVETPRPYKSGKRLYVGETASSRDGKWYTATNSNYLLVPVEGGTTIRITANNERQCRYAFLVNDANGAAVTISGTTFYEANYATGEEMKYLDAGETIDLVVPNDANYLYLYNDSVLGRTYFTPSFVGVKRSWEDSINKGVGTDITDWNPEFSMLDLVKSMAYKGKTSLRSNIYGCFVFAHITDCHGRDNEQYSKWSWERFLRFCRYYKSMNERFIIDMVDTGDVVADSAAVSGTAVTSDWRVDGNDVLTVIGNHDVADKVSGSLNYTRIGLTAYNQFLADKIGEWGVTQPSGAASNGYCYFYKDYEIGGGESSSTDPTPYGLRAIFIDCMDWLKNGSASLAYHQAAFVKTALDGALNEGRHVIIFTHDWPGAMINFDCKWNESPYNEHYQDIGDALSRVGNDNTYNYLAFLVAKFQASGGGFAGYVCGHHHAGFIGQKTGTCTFDGETIDFDNGTPQIVICGTYARLMTTSFTSQSGNLAWCDLNTKNQDCFRLISVDTSHSYIKLMQIGKEYDYVMRHRDILGINYRTYQPFDESVITYTRNSIVAKDGFLWRILTPAFKDVEGVTHTDWANTIKVIYNRVLTE